MFEGEIPNLPAKYEKMCKQVLESHPVDADVAALITALCSEQVKILQTLTKFLDENVECDYTDDF